MQQAKFPTNEKAAPKRNAAFELYLFIMIT